MLRSTTVLLALALLPTITSAAPPSCASHSFYSTQTDDGKEIGLYVTDAQVSRLTRWDPTKGEPPLAVGAAIARALAWARSNWKEFDGFDVESIQLTPVGCAFRESKWVYVVSFRPRMKGYPLMAPGYFVGVLTDGTVLAPRTRG